MISGDSLLGELRHLSTLVPGTDLRPGSCGRYPAATSTGMLHIYVYISCICIYVYIICSLYVIISYNIIYIYMTCMFVHRDQCGHGRLSLTDALIAA